METEEEIKELRGRVMALEWALQNLLVVLDGEEELTRHQALIQALHTAAERADAHKLLSGLELQALLRLADWLAGIPAELPDYLKQLRRG